MTLLDIKAHLKTVRSANLYQLSYHFKADPQQLKRMLAHWIRKGKVRACTKTPKCGVQCQACSDDSTVLYEWVA